MISKITRYFFCFFISLFFCFFYSSQIWSQNKIQVIDYETSLPLEGVTINSGKKTTATDENGFLHINKIQTPSLTDTIILSFIGYHTRKLILAEVHDSLIHMYPQSISLDEVTVTGKRSLQKSIIFKELAPMKYGVFAFGYTSVGDSIFIVGGDETRKDDYHDKYEWENNNGKIQIYNIKTNQWHIPDIRLSDRAFHNAHYYDGKIYVLGGKRLAPNRKREYLNDKIEAFNTTCDTIYSSNVNPHQAINFASGVFDDYIIIMNGSTKKHLNRTMHTKQVHLFDLKTGSWYKLKDIPFAYETTGIVVDSILYQIGGFNNVAVRFINTYNILTEEHCTPGILPNEMERPSLAYNEDIIYIYEKNKLLTFNLINQEICMYKIELGLDLMYSGLIYRDGYLYIMGGRSGNNVKNLSAPSNKLFRINIEEFERTESHKIKLKSRGINK